MPSFRLRQVSLRYNHALDHALVPLYVRHCDHNVHQGRQRYQKRRLYGIWFNCVCTRHFSLRTVKHAKTGKVLHP